MSDIALNLLLANLAAAIAILLVIALRKPVRAAFGARLAYGLWLLAPLSAIGSLAPPRSVEIVRPPPAKAFAPAPVMEAEPLVSVADAPSPALAIPASAGPFLSFDPWAISLVLWLAGAIVMAIWLVRAQRRFLADARAGFAGPAVAGVLHPRIITPADFEERFEREERKVIIAHETIHLANNDARINAIIALLRCLCWFNPLVHVGAHLMRIDQELACDATVIERHPKSRAIYAAALLKAQLAARPLPLGCYWPAGADHPLTQRIKMLKQAAPGRIRRIAGAAVVTFLAVAAGAAAWAARPPQHQFVDAPANAAPGLAAGKAITATMGEPGQLPNALEEALPQRDRIERQAASFDPQEAAAKAPASGETAFASLFDENDPIVVNGAITRVDLSNGFALVWMQASQAIAPASPEAGSAPTGLAPGAGLFRIMLGRAGNAPDWIDQSLVGKSASIRGYRAKDKACTDGCLINGRDVLVDGVRRYLGRQADPPLMPTRYEPQQPDEYDASSSIYLRGTVERIDFSDAAYTVFVRAENVASDPYSLSKADNRLWALNPVNYFGDPDNRQRVEESLFGKRIDVFGYKLQDASCTPACRIHAVEAILQPAPTVFEGGFAGLKGREALNAVIDERAPVQIMGTVVRFDSPEESATPHGVLWVEATNVEPAGTPGAEAGTMWRVAGFPGHVLQARFWQGAEVTVNGFNVRDKSCEPACVMVGKQILNGFSGALPGN